MRVRVAVLLIALLAIVALPSEAMPTEQTGSVVDQVTSCLQPNGLARDVDHRSVAGDHCRDDGPLRPPLAVLAVVAALLAGLAPLARSRSARRGVDRWRLPDAVTRSGASWRAPPVAV